MGFCGVSSTPEIFTFIAFLGHIFGKCGIHCQTFFENFRKKNLKFTNFSKILNKLLLLTKKDPKTHFWPNLALKVRFGAKKPVFYKFRRLRRQNRCSFRPPSAAEVSNTHPLRAYT